jgi:hypothetical protein
VKQGLPHIALDIKTPTDAAYRRIGRGVGPYDQPGSFTHDPPDADRVLYVFGYLPQDGPAVWRTVSNEAVALGCVRHAGTRTFEYIADLRDGPYVVEVFRPALGMVRVRTRLVK